MPSVLPVRTSRPVLVYRAAVRRLGAAFLIALALTTLALSAPVGQQAVVGAPLAEPPVLRSANGELAVTLVLDEGTATIAGEEADDVWTYHVGEEGAANYPGPTLWVRPGDTLRIRYVNRLEGQETNLHTHGLHVSPLGNSDNVLLDIPSGDQNEYRIKIPENHPCGLYWYHPHRHGFVHPQLYRGLSGMLVVGRPDSGAAELDGLRQRLMAFQYSLVVDGTLIQHVGLLTGNERFTVNGQLQPTVDIRPNELQVWNLINVSNNATFAVRLRGTGSLADQPLVLVAQDGNPYRTPATQSADRPLVMVEGSRYSLLVKGPPAGTYELVMEEYFDGFRTWPARTLATVVSAGVPLEPPVIPTHLTPPANAFEPLDRARSVNRRVVVFSRFDHGDSTNFLINGKVFPENAVFQPRLNQVEEWVITTDNDINDHPFHLHTNGFQVVSVYDPRNPQNNVTTPRGWFQDVINVPPLFIQGGRRLQGRVVIRFRPRDFLGNHVYHCHRAHHEDLGMMAQVAVIPETPIYAVAASSGPPLVRVFSGLDNRLLAQFLAFGPGFQGGVRVAVGDVNGDAIQDVIAGAGPRGAPRVKVFDGATGFRTVLHDFLAYEANSRGGVNVAAGDVNGDGRDDIVTGAGAGSAPEVKVFDGVDGGLLGRFLAYDPPFTGGVNVAAGIVHDGGRVSIITGPGAGHSPEVRVFEAAGMHGAGAHGGCSCDTGACRCRGGCHCASDEAGAVLDFHLVAQANAYDPSFLGGVNVGTGIVEGQNGGFGSVLTGPAGGAAPLVKAFVLTGGHDHSAGSQGGDDPSALEERTAWLAYSPAVRAGVGVAAVSTLTASDLLVGPGRGVPPHLKRARFQPGSNSFAPVASFFPFPVNSQGGISLGGR